MSAEMINNHKKVVFLDVDGTMVNDRGEIPESTKEAVRRAKANGHKMVVCTGRSRFQIYDELLELGFSGIVGGAGVFVIADGKEIYHAYIGELIVLRHLDAAQHVCDAGDAQPGQLLHQHGVQFQGIQQVVLALGGVEPPQQ